jgi:predicted  nucleic acid-binding Zn-ribbon protein
VGVLRWTCLIVGLLVFPAWAAGDIQQEIRRVEAALAMLAQDQQSVYQQFQMVQVLLRSEESRMQALQTYTPPATPPSYDDVRREEGSRTARIRQYQDELDRLYSRYRELEAQRNEMLKALSALVQQRNEDD